MEIASDPFNHKGQHMIRILRYTIDELNPLPVYEFLKNKGYSRNLIRHIKKEDQGILLNGRCPFVTDMLKPGDHLQITIKDNEPAKAVTPTPMDIKIIYEDEDLLIVNKNADIPIHPSLNNYHSSLANGLSWYFKENGQNCVFRCINRLDRDTTGLTVIAKNMLSACILSEMARNRVICRSYLAVVTGEITKGGTISAPLSRKENSIVERKVDFIEGVSAITHYEPIKWGKGHTLLLVRLETGRTHQIRVHFKHIGHPLPGDYLYNPDYRFIKRQALHSYQLAFTHPITQKNMKFEAPLPEDMNFF